jgi:demethylmenaquinone methyltransferase / 2-methoxy-6-polyprenyl-1,4-benzoquinol methylase
LKSSDPRLALVERFFRGTGGTYDLVVNVATFGIDRLWKRRIVSLIPPGSERILDLACGTGISTAAIAKRFPRSRIVGVELREEYLAVARKRFRNTENIEFVLSRAEDYRSSERFDCITSSYLAKYAELPLLVRNCRAMLKEGGLFLMHDFTLPQGPFLVGLWRAYFKALQLVGGALLPSWREIYHGLPRLIEETRWLAQLQQALAENGFREIRIEHLTAYGSAIVSAQTPSNHTGGKG